MARKPLTPEADETSSAAAPSLPEGVTDETVVVADEAEAPASEARETPALPPGVTEETVVVSEAGVTPAAATTPMPAVAPDAEAVPAADVGPMVVVTCTVAGGRRRAGRRWPAGTTRVARSELSAEDIEALNEDVLLRVEVA